MPVIFRPILVFIPSAFQSAEVDCRLTRLHKTITMPFAWSGCEMRYFNYREEIKLQKDCSRKTFRRKRDDL